MDRAENCFFCGRTSPEADLVAWFVRDERRWTHNECWLEAYRSQRQPAELLVARPDSRDREPRKTLEDIRRDLEAEYPAEPETPKTHLPGGAYLNGDVAVVERHRAASRRRARRRRYATAGVVGGLAGLLLLVGYVAVTNAPRDLEPRVVEPAPAVPPPAVPAPAVPPPALAELDRELKALRSDLQELAARLERSDSRIAGMESRVRDAESSMRRLARDVAPSAATRAVERSVAVPRDTPRKPAPVAPRPPTPAPVTVANSERWIASDRSAPPSPPPPSEVRPRAEAVQSPRIESTTRTDDTPGPAARPVDDAPGPAARPADDAPGPAARPVSDDASPPSAPPTTLRDRLRADWRTIKQGFATAGNDFKATVRDFTRKVTGERRTLQ